MAESAREKSVNKAIITAIAVVALIGIFLFASGELSKITGQTVNNNVNIEEIVKCLNEKNTVLYVKAGCPHCAEQEEFFGKHLNELKVIDCAEVPEICVINQIEYIPTLVIGGKYYVGNQDEKFFMEVCRE